MKKRSMVISLYKIIRRTLTVILITVLGFGAIHFDILQYITSKMADTVFAADSKVNSENIAEFFSLSGKSAIESVLVYNKNKETVTPIAVVQSPEKTESVYENVGETVDISHAKPANAVEANNIIVSNAPGKNFNVAELLARPLEFEKTDGYKVLVIHTHTTESYLPDDRHDDPQKNMIRVGEVFTDVLEKNGIKTLHCKTVHDKPYSLSYKNQLTSIEKILKENPTVEAVIDVHRDALYNANQEKLKPAVIVNGETAAQVMLVCGTDASGLLHETWQSCFSFAIKVQNNMNNNYPNLARPINLRTERFNTHMTKNSVIFEIGANGNTLGEALTGAKYAAQAVADVLNKK